MCPAFFWCLLIGYKNSPLIKLKPFFFNGGHPVVFQYRGICIYVNNRTEVVKITTYILINAWRRVSAVFTTIFRPTYSTGQVRAVFVPDLYYKLA